MVNKFKRIFKIHSWKLTRKLKILTQYPCSFIVWICLLQYIAYNWVSSSILTQLILYLIYLLVECNGIWKDFFLCVSISTEYYNSWKNIIPLCSYVHIVVNMCSCTRSVSSKDKLNYSLLRQKFLLLGLFKNT